MSESKSSGGIGLAGWLFLIFLTLKLCGVIAWSWWWVTAPLWVGLALVLAILFGISAFAGGVLTVIGVFSALRRRFFS